MYSDDFASIIQSTYSSALTIDSQKYGRRDCEWPNYYYEAIQVNVETPGLYIFMSNSEIDMFGYFYENYFNPLNPSENQLFRDDDGCRHGQFKVIGNLQSSTSYVLVVTTFSHQATSQFMISAFGPKTVTFKNISKSIRQSLCKVQISIKINNFS